MTIHSINILRSNSLSTHEHALFDLGIISSEPVISAQTFLTESNPDETSKSFFITANIQYENCSPNNPSYCLEKNRHTLKLRIHHIIDAAPLLEETDYQKRHAFGTALHIRMMHQVQHELFKHLCEQEVLPLIILESLILDPATFDIDFDTQTLSITPFSHYLQNIKLPRLFLIEQTMKFLKEKRELSFTCNAISDFKNENSFKNIFDDYENRRFKPYSVTAKSSNDLYDQTENALQYVLKETCYELMLNTHNRESHENKIFANFVHTHNLIKDTKQSGSNVNHSKFTPLYFDNAIKLLSKLESKNKIEYVDMTVYLEIIKTMKKGLEMLATTIDNTAHHYTT